MDAPDRDAFQGARQPHISAAANWGEPGPLLGILTAEPPNREAAHRKAGEVLAAGVNAVMLFDPIDGVPNVGFAHPFVPDIAAAKGKERDEILGKAPFMDAKTFFGDHP